MPSSDVSLFQDIETAIRGGKTSLAIQKLNGRDAQRIMVEREIWVNNLLILILELRDARLLEYVLGLSRAYYISLYPQAKLFRRQLVLEENVKANVFMSAAMQGAFDSSERLEDRDKNLVAMVASLFTATRMAAREEYERNPKAFGSVPSQGNRPPAGQAWSRQDTRASSATDYNILDAPSSILNNQGNIHEREWNFDRTES